MSERNNIQSIFENLLQAVSLAEDKENTDSNQLNKESDYVPLPTNAFSVFFINSVKVRDESED